MNANGWSMREGVPTSPKVPLTVTLPDSHTQGRAIVKVRPGKSANQMEGISTTSLITRLQTLVADVRELNALTSGEVADGSTETESRRVR